MAFLSFFYQRPKLIALIVLVVLFLGVTKFNSSEARPLTSADAIEMTTVTDPDFSRWWESKTFKHSPDGDHFFIITQTPDLATAQNVSELIVYSRQAILEELERIDERNGRSLISTGEVVARFESSTNGTQFSGIREARWTSDNSTIAFIAESGRDASQVYIVDINSKVVEQLTFHDRPVRAFDLSMTARTLVYISDIAKLPPNSGQEQYVFGVNTISSLFNAERPMYSVLHQRYSKSFDEVEGIPIGASFSVNGTMLKISPDGRWAISRQRIETPSAKWLSDYPFLSANAENQMSSFDSNIMRSPLLYYGEFVLLNLESGFGRRVLDAPSANVYNGIADAAWSPDSNSIILANTFLPLDESDGAERESRRRSPSVIEYELGTGRITEILRFDTLAPTGRPNQNLLSATFENGVLSIEYSKRSLSGGDAEHHLEHYEKQAGGWVHVEKQPKRDTEFTVSLKQGFEQPPELHLISGGKKAILTDLNPQFDELSFGRVKELTWPDQSGREWKGAIVYPVGYEAGHRYPLVIQTHGYEKDKFLMDGLPLARGAYAAQALANRGIMVVQMQDWRPSTSDEQELELHLEGIEGLIDHLDGEQLINPSKVGIVGFSRTGLYVQHAITFSEYDFAAATIADAANVSMSLYTNMFGQSLPGMPFVEKFLDDARPWGARLSDWTRNNPTFQLDKIRTPLRLEQYTGMHHWWDTYTILKRQGKPVEWIVVAPDEHSVLVHNLVRPYDRFYIQQGNIDWFDFWLNGVERTVPIPNTPETAESLQEQYDRWNELKRQQDKSRLAANEAREWQNQEDARREAADAWLQTPAGERATSLILEQAE